MMIMRTRFIAKFGNSECLILGYCKNCGRLLERSHDGKRWQHFESRWLLISCGNPQREEKFNNHDKLLMYDHKLDEKLKGAQYERKKIL